MPSRTERLIEFCHALIDQQAARVIVEPQERSSGFWFGGGNMIADEEGNLFVVGRFRNAGDSRTGIAAGTRGLELAVFKSGDHGYSFQKMISWDKAALNNQTGEVLSIEGSCIRFTPDGVELFVSTEKSGVDYPSEVADYLKPGAGVWSIDVLRAETLHGLVKLKPEPAVVSDNSEHLHVKDPFFWYRPDSTALGFCGHPFGWSSSNTSVVDLQPGAELQHAVFPRGTTWDVAMTRGTCVLPLPAVGEFAERPNHLLFYCGGECLRPLDEHSTAVKRPRGYSCEEIGGAALIVDGDVSSAERLSRLAPLFISPYGTGCSRYVDVLETPEGYYASWQQSQDDLSQPLVMNFVSRAKAEAILGG